MPSSIVDLITEDKARLSKPIVYQYFSELGLTVVAYSAEIVHGSNTQIYILRGDQSHALQGRLDGQNMELNLANQNLTKDYLTEVRTTKGEIEAFKLVEQSVFDLINQHSIVSYTQTINLETSREFKPKVTSSVENNLFLHFVGYTTSPKKYNGNIVEIIELSLVEMAIRLSTGLLLGKKEDLEKLILKYNLEVNLNIIVDGSSFNIVELWQSLNLEGFKITYSGENRIFSKIIKPEVDEKTNEKRSLMGGNH